jgi:CBS domain-containing protein
MTRASEAERPPTFAKTRVGAVMHQGVITCPMQTPLRAVAGIMAAHRVHCVVVYDETGDAELDAVWGVVSDLGLAGALSSDEIETGTAGEIAGAPVVTVRPQEELVRAAQLMREHETSHLVVVDRRTERPIGVLSTLDLARTAADQPRGRRSK